MPGRHPSDPVRETEPCPGCSQSCPCRVLSPMVWSDAHHDEKLGEALQITILSEKGYCLRIWDPLWDAREEHRIYYCMFTGGAKGGEGEVSE